VSHFEKIEFQNSLALYDTKLDAIYNGVSEHFKPITNKEELKRVKEAYNLPINISFLGNTDPKKKYKRNT
jgi:hypothetical protein